MNTIELKNNFHNLIDSIDNENFLIAFYELMKKRFSSKDGQLWNNLSKQEQDELLISYSESENADNLISNEEMKKKHSQWF